MPLHLIHLTANTMRLIADMLTQCIAQEGNSKKKKRKKKKKGGSQVHTLHTAFQFATAWRSRPDTGKDKDRLPHPMTPSKTWHCPSRIGHYSITCGHVLMRSHIDIHDKKQPVFQQPHLQGGLTPAGKQLHLWSKY